MPRIRLENLHDEILGKLGIEGSLVPFYIDCNDISEANLKNVSYVNNGTSIDTANKKFGAGSYLISGSGLQNVIIPKTDTNNFKFSDEWAISLWIKKSSGSVTVFEDPSSRVKLVLNASGQAVFTLVSSDDITRTLTGSTDLSDDVWHNIIINGRTNKLATDDKLELYIDGTQEASIDSVDIYVQDDNFGCLVLGQGVLRAFASTVNYTGSVLPESDTPAWSKGGSGAAAVLGGLLTIDTQSDGGMSQCDWSISDGANWTVDNTNGYWAEMKAKFINGSGNLTLQIGDGSKYEALTISAGQISILNNGTPLTYSVDATDYHVYRISLKGDNVKVYIDYKLVLTGTASAGASDYVKFGDVSTTNDENIKATIDWVRYYQSDADEGALLDSALFNGNIDSLVTMKQECGLFNRSTLQNVPGSDFDQTTLQKLNQEIDDRITGDKNLASSISALETSAGNDNSALSSTVDANYEEFQSSTASILTTLDVKADLVGGLVPLTQLPPQVKEMQYVTDIAARDAISNKFVGLSVYVEDATADATVASGGAFYMWTGSTFSKLSEAESLDVVLEWANIQNKPAFGTGHDDFARGDAVTNEATARANADTTLQNNIDALSSSTEEDLGTLTTNLNSEVTNRGLADTSLSNRINALSSSTAESLTDEATTRGNADTTLQGNIDSLSSSTAESLADEVTARGNADTTLQSNIDALSSSTEVVTDGLDTRIEDLEQGGNLGELSSSVSELETDLSQEITDRGNADTTLQSNIDALSSSTAESDADLNTAISNEVTARGNADTTLQNNINALSSSTAESLTDEATARGNADTTLQGNIDSLSSSTAESLADEVTARGNADTTLQNNINALSSSTAAESDADLNTAISNEVTARGNADTTLQNNINALSSSTDEADAAIITRIEDLEEGGNLGELSSSVDELEADLNQEIIDRGNADTSLQNNINSLSSSTAESLADEVTARTNADTSLNNRINSLSSSTAESLADEVTARTNADTSLNNSINSKYEEFQSSTSDIYTKLDAKADLVGGVIPINQIPAAAKEMKYVANIAARDAIADKFVGLQVLVEDAAADTNVTTGSAVYFCYSTSPVSWKKISELDSTDLFTNWSHIQNKPAFGTAHEDFARGDAAGTVQANLEALSSSTAETDANLNTAINNEAFARGNADTTLQNNIDALASSTTEDIGDEATIRSNADNALQNQINSLSSSTGGDVDQEIIDRTNADTALSNS